MWKFETPKQKRLRKIKTALVFDIALDHFVAEANANREAGIIDLHPISKAVNYTRSVIKAGLLNKKYELITGIKL